MDWLRNRTVQGFTIIGLLGGLLTFIAGLWLEFTNHRLPMAWWAILVIHHTQPFTLLQSNQPAADIFSRHHALQGRIR